MGLIQRNGVGASAFDAPFVVDMAIKAGLPAIADDVTVAAGGRALSLGLAAHYFRSAVETASMHGLSESWRGLPVTEWQGRLAVLEQHLGLNDQNQIAPRHRQLWSAHALPPRPKRLQPLTLTALKKASPPSHRAPPSASRNWCTLALMIASRPAR